MFVIKYKQKNMRKNLFLLGFMACTMTMVGQSQEKRKLVF